MSRIYLAYRSKKQRFCAVQAFCAAKPWRRANSLRPSILISHRNPKKEVTTYVVTSFLERATRLTRGVITPRHAQRAPNAPLGRFLASLAPCSPLCPLEPKNRRFCAVQAFCAAKPWRRANSLRPSILISHRNPKKEVTTYVVTSFLERATRLTRGVITPRHAQRAPNAPLGRFLASLAPCSPLCPLEPKNKGMTYVMPLFFGAGDEARTRYLHLGKVALYQMSYARGTRCTIPDIFRFVKHRF